MIHTVIFDFNGTLFLDSEYHQKAWIQYAKYRFNIDMSEQYFKKEVMGKPNVKILQSLNPGLPLQQANIYSNEKEEWYRKMVVNADNPRLVEGAIELFELLKSYNIPFTIASAANVDNFIFYRKVFNLDKYFNPKLLVIDDGTYNNKIEMYQKAVEILNGNKDTTYVFEDSYIGIECTLKAGIQQIGIINDHCIDPRFKTYLNFNQVLQEDSFVLKLAHE